MLTSLSETMRVILSSDTLVHHTRHGTIIVNSLESTMKKTKTSMMLDTITVTSTTDQATYH